jgi:hypothetical protein
MSYLKQMQALTGSIAASNGTLVAVTSEPISELAATRSASGYTGDVIAFDPENVLTQELKRSGLVDVAISSKSGYAHGMAQPTVLVLAKDGTVLEKWAIVPSMVGDLMPDMRIAANP